jgi:DNA-binding PadR family transcriptional regulator
MSLSNVVLGLLSDAPAHGYDLKRVHDARFPGSKKLPYGQIYATLARLQRDGLVEAVETGKESGPERTVYAITESGQRVLRTWLEETEPAGPYVAHDLVRKAITALHSDAGAEEFLRRQRSVHLAAMRAATQELLAAEEIGPRIALDHTLVHLDADLRWLDSARARVAAESSNA